jgi:selenocysteine lyase/cysteine desulfurase
VTDSAVSLDLAKIRADFPGLAAKDGQIWHYLDSGATAQKPQAVIDATVNAMGRDYATVHRGVYARSANMTLAYEAARRALSAGRKARSSSPVARPRRSIWWRKVGVWSI